MRASSAVGCRYVLEERSPYAKPMKKGSSRQGARKDCGYDDLEDDLSVRMTGTVAAKNNVPDQNLTVEQMYKRYEGNATSTHINEMKQLTQQSNND